MRLRELFALVGTTAFRTILVLVLTATSPLMELVHCLALILAEQTIDVGKVFTCFALFNSMFVPLLNLG